MTLHTTMGRETPRPTETTSDEQAETVSASVPDDDEGQYVATLTPSALDLYLAAPDKVREYARFHYYRERGRELGVRMARARDQDIGPDSLAGGALLTRSALATLPPVRPFIAGVLKRPSAAVLVGAYGSYKSFLSLSWGLCSATGKQWLGRDVERARVLLVVGEGANGLDTRIRAWELTFNGGQQVPDEDFTVLSAPGSLADPATWTAITLYAVANGVGFVILDTLSSLAPDADETKDSAPIMRHLSDLATAIDGPALLVHHPGHSDHGRTRGGYQFEGNADEVLVMARPSKESPIASLTVKKSKDDGDGTVMWLSAETVTELLPDDDMRTVSLVLREVGAQAVAVPMADRLLTLLVGQEDAGITPRQARIALGQDPDSGTGRSTFTDAIKALRDRGVLMSKGSGAATRYFHTDHAPDGAR